MGRSRDAIASNKILCKRPVCCQTETKEYKNKFDATRKSNFYLDRAARASVLHVIVSKVSDCKLACNKAMTVNLEKRAK